MPGLVILCSVWMGGDIRAVIYGRRRSYLTGSNCMHIHVLEIGTWSEMTGKYTITLHSCISVTDRVKTNEYKTSVATGPIYVGSECKPI